MSRNQLHQMNMEYQPTEDRLVLKINTMDKQEYRLWMTRRFTKQFWDSIIKIVEQAPDVKKHADPEVKKAVMAFQQENKVKSEQFEKPYVEGADRFPLGEDPVLLTGFAYSPKGPNGMPRMAFQTIRGLEVALPVNDQIIFSIAKLLAQVGQHTGWDLEFEMGFKSDESPETVIPTSVH